MKSSIFVIVTLGIFQSSCTENFQGSYKDPQEVTIVDEYWNETDARSTSATLIQSMLGKSWLSGFAKRNNGKRPMVILKGVENRTSEHIDTRALVEAMRFELINSDAIRFVDGENREKILKEMEYQNSSGMVSSATTKQKGRQIGADFILTGSISSQVHKKGNLQTVTYQTIMQLSDLETAEIVWNGKHDVSKAFKRSSLGW